MSKKTFSKIPKSLKWVLWSANVNQLDKEKDKYYIIHQILACGTLKEIIWVFKNYPTKTIISIFKQSFREYRRSRFYFVKNYLLKLKVKKIFGAVDFHINLSDQISFNTKDGVGVTFFVLLSKDFFISRQIQLV